MCSRVLWLAMAVVALAVAGFAQNESATLSGRVTDSTGAALANASVSVINQSTAVERRTMSNEAGLYVVVGLTPGNYRIVVKHDGFAQFVMTDVILHVQDSVAENCEMRVGSVSESMTVKADTVKVNTESAEVSTVVDRQFVENMPLNGRSFQSLIELTPGVTAVPGAGVGNQGEFTINGQRTEANYYMVDGVSANTGQLNIWTVGATPQETQLGTTQSMVSLDALQEFRINSSSYSAEYGRTPGGQISFQTRPGTNTWHGSLFDYFRNDALDANNWFNTFYNPPIPKTAERQNDFGGTLGGPVRIPGLYNGKDKTFFFFSYEGLRLRLPNPAVPTQVPDTANTLNGLNLRSQVHTMAPALDPLVNAFPLPNGPEVLDGSGNPTGLADFTAAYSAPSSLNAYSIRVDHDFGDKLKIFGRYADTPSFAETRNQANLAEPTATTSNIKVVTIGATSMFTPRLVNELRFNYTKNNILQETTADSFGGARPISLGQTMPGIMLPQYSSFIWFLQFGGVNYPSVHLGSNFAPSNQWNITDSVTSAFGSHTLKYGIDYRRQFAVEGLNQLSPGFEYLSASEITGNASALGFVSTINPLPGGIFKNFSAFVQDEWKATQRLHVSLGLRWDLNPAPTGTPHNPYTLNEITNLATATLAPLGTPVYHTDYRGFAPRIGLAYQLRQTGGLETVVRGGFGIFYDIGNNNALYGATGGVGVGSSGLFPGAAFPFTESQLNTLPAPSAAPPWSSVYASDPNLRLPYTLEWNAAVEQGLGRSQTLTFSYVGSAGRRLLHSQLFTVPENPNFALDDGTLTLTTNGGTSDYDALQIQFQRRLAHGFEALASYTWSHSIDDESYNGNWTSGQGGTYDVLLRGNSNFDVRHNFTAAVTYSVPGSYTNRLAEALLKGWGIDLRQTNRTALPVDVTDGATFSATTNQEVYVRPDVVPGVPFYLNDPAAPGGRVINSSAFTTPAGPIGNEPRNFLRGFGAWQTDLAVRREFPLPERLKLQFRAEAFNLFNHPNFGVICPDLVYCQSSALLPFGHAYNTLNNSLGGLSALYQMGGPRSLQIALKLEF
jgi:hypothetical protein